MPARRLMGQRGRCLGGWSGQWRGRGLKRTASATKKITTQGLIERVTQSTLAYQLLIKSKTWNVLHL